MKVYVSEKENIDLSKNCFLTFSTKDKETVDWNVWNVLAQSLEQHEQEIRKPLEEEIERLKFENKNKQNAIKLVDEAKYTAQQDDIDFFVEQERQKVIAELEEWINKNEIYQKHMSGSDVVVVDTNTVKRLALKQKLNEMKGESL